MNHNLLHLQLLVYIFLKTRDLSPATLPHPDLEIWSGYLHHRPPGQEAVQAPSEVSVTLSLVGSCSPWTQ